MKIDQTAPKRAREDLLVSQIDEALGGYPGYRGCMVRAGDPIWIDADDVTPEMRDAVRGVVEGHDPAAKTEREIEDEQITETIRQLDEGRFESPQDLARVLKRLLGREIPPRDAGGQGGLIGGILGRNR